MPEIGNADWRFALGAALCGWLDCMDGMDDMGGMSVDLLVAAWGNVAELMI